MENVVKIRIGVCPIVNAPAGRLLGAYDLGVATPRALVHAGDKTSGDARSWYMISGDAKSWVVIVLHIFTVILHNCPLFEGNGEIDGQGGQVGGQVGGRGNQCNNQGNGRNQNGDAFNDNIWGDVRNFTKNNDRRGCTYKEFLACNPKEYDGKGGAIVYTR
ncbi:hypothetical protein Tco_1086516 [Tanacetum coccineum]